MALPEGLAKTHGSDRRPHPDSAGTPICEIAVNPIAFPKVSGVHARIEPAANGFALVHLSRNNKDYVSMIR